jgi:hypothetical protein
MKGGWDMMKFNSVDEFAQVTDIDTLLDIQYHVNKAIEQIRVDSLNKSTEGSATASISIALYEDYFLLIEFNYSWLNGVFVDDEEVKLTLLNMDEWLDYYNEHKSEFKVVKNDT